MDTRTLSSRANNCALSPLQENMLWSLMPSFNIKKLPLSAFYSLLILSLCALMSDRLLHWGHTVLLTRVIYTRGGVVCERWPWRGLRDFWPTPRDSFFFYFYEWAAPWAACQWAGEESEREGEEEGERGGGESGSCSVRQRFHVVLTVNGEADQITRDNMGGGIESGLAD